jgi:hypothetical protein
METVPNRKTPLFAGKGQLLVSSPRNRTLRCAETVAHREMGTWSNGVEVGPPSNVTIRVKVVTNPGRSFASAFGQAVPGRAGSSPVYGCTVIQTQKTGRVVQVGAADFDDEDSQSSVLQGSGRLVLVFGWHQAQSRRRKNGRAKPDINNVHDWS